LLVAFLVGLTDPAQSADIASTAVQKAHLAIVTQTTEQRRADSNTFIQLEGWQNHLPYVLPGTNKRHSADYATHKATLWNFSTFGACAYSEKRSTPIFLAGSGFSTALNTTTHMPLYNGALGSESWMNPNLLALPAS
jgi:hypothetical protein